MKQIHGRNAGANGRKIAVNAKAISGRGLRLRGPPRVADETHAAEVPDAPSHPQPSFPIVGIGASAGGLEAFTNLLQHLPSDTGMGLVLVQHLDPNHSSALSELLARTTRLPVTEVRNGMKVEPNHVYVIPPNANMSIRLANAVCCSMAGKFSGKAKARI